MLKSAWDKTDHCRNPKTKGRSNSLPAPHFLGPVGEERREPVQHWFTQSQICQTLQKDVMVDGIKQQRDLGGSTGTHVPCQNPSQSRFHPSNQAWSQIEAGLGNQFHTETLGVVRPLHAQGPCPEMEGLTLVCNYWAPLNPLRFI